MEHEYGKEPLLERSSIFHGLLLSILTAAISFLVTTYSMAETEYIYALNEALANGRGPYEVGLIAVIALLCVYYRERIWDFLKRAFRALEFSVADVVALAIVLWGFIPWSNLPLPSIERLRLQHVNTLAQALVVIGLCWLVPRAAYLAYRCLTKKPSSEKPRLFSDRPIGRHLDDEDLIGRTNIVGQITSAIKDYDSEGSFVIALTGNWGTGKTSVLNIVMRELQQDAVFMEFDPWYFSVGHGRNLDGLLGRFFDALEGALKPYTFRPNIHKLLRKYQKAISPTMKQAAISLDFPLGEQETDLRTIQRKLNRAFQKLSFRFVVVIDDLDRMDGAEIAFVFKIIRLCANSDNLVYLVAFDRSFVEDQLKEQLGSKGKDYVDKIVQLELPLPKVEPVVLGGIFTEYLRDADRQLGLSLWQDEDFLRCLNRVLNPHILQLLNSVRLVKLLINRYLLAVPPVKGEVNYFDLLVLEIIRLRYLVIYEKIFKNPERFSYQNSVNWVFPQDQDKDEAKFYEELVNGLDPQDREPVLTLLGAVFNSVRLWHTRQNVVYDFRHDVLYRERKSAAHPHYFPRYFHYDVQHGVIPDVLWDDHIKHINTEPEDDVAQMIDRMITEWVSVGSIGTWLARMRLSVRRIEPGKIPIFLSVLSKRSVELSTNKMSPFSASDYQLLFFLMVDLLERLVPKCMEDTMLRLIDTCPDLDLLRHLLRELESEHDERQKDGFDYSKLKQKAGDRLRQAYLNADRNILLESHRYGGLLALIDWLAPSEFKPYTKKLLAEEKLNAVRLLSALTTYGQQHGMDGVRSYRILQYPTVKSLVDPGELLRAVKDVELDSELSEDQVWALDALQIGIDDEAAGKKVIPISELDLERRQYEQAN